MQLLVQFWTALTCLMNRLTLSPFDVAGVQQQPLFDKSEFRFDVHSPQTASEPQVADYPVFKPPTGRLKGDGSNFECEYPKMEDWMFCSLPEDRECWLRHKNGSEFNIHTNYEKFKPIGIDRNYSIDVVDQWINADGVNFTTGKVFRWADDTDTAFPGPWIQACWGDVSDHMKFKTSKLLYGHHD